MRTDEHLLQVLAVDCPLDDRGDELDVASVDSVRATLNALRTGHFDLLLTTLNVAGEPIWPLAEKVRRVRPKLQWWLVANGITNAEEILARTLGVTRILGRAPTADAIEEAIGGPRPRRLPVSRSIDSLHVADVGT